MAMNIKVLHCEGKIKSGKANSGAIKGPILCQFLDLNFHPRLQ